jgi:hypothetical protein
VYENAAEQFRRQFLGRAGEEIEPDRFGSAQQTRQRPRQADKLEQ